VTDWKTLTLFICFTILSEALTLYIWFITFILYHHYYFNKLDHYLLAEAAAISVAAPC